MKCNIMIMKLKDELDYFHLFFFPEAAVDLTETEINEYANIAVPNNEKHYQDRWKKARLLNLYLAQKIFGCASCFFSLTFRCTQQT